MASTHRTPASDPGQLALSLVRELERPDSDVYLLFSQLDALPPETVLAALAGTTGASRPPEELDDDVRRVHGFPPPPLHLACTHVVVPVAGARLAETTAEQIESACTTWDGLALPLAARLTEGAPHSLAGAIEHRTLDDLDGMPQFDVVLLHGDSGAIFRAGTTDVLGTIAYGKVEVRDRRERRALQEALDAPAGAPVEATTVVTFDAPAPAAVAAAPAEEAAVAATVIEEAAPTKRARVSRAAPAKKAAAAPEPKAVAKPEKKAAAAPKKKAAAATATAPKKKAATAPKKKTATATTKKKAAAAPKKKTTAATTKKKAAAAPKKKAAPKKAARMPAKKAKK